MRTTTTIGELTVNYAQQWMTMGEREVKLSQRERRLLAALAQNARRVVLQDTLLEYVYRVAL
jgi:DNA-binding response OmpR family regulator